MLLDELKKMIKEFETVLVKDERFKDDASFKNQVKIIYSKDKKPTNLMAPILLGNLSSINNTDEITKLKNRIKYLEKIENIPCNCEEKTSDSLFETEPLLRIVERIGRDMLNRTSIEEDLQIYFHEMGEDSTKLHAIETDKLVDFFKDTSFKFKKVLASKTDGTRKEIITDKYNDISREDLKKIIDEFKRTH
jgi:hypothetical protein